MSMINKTLYYPFAGLFNYIKNNPNAGLVVIFCCLAIISSFDGLMTLIGWIRPKEFDLSLWFWYCFKSIPVLLVVILLQVVLVKALYECIDNIMEIFTTSKSFIVTLIANSLASASWLVIYLFIMGLSVFFSYQFYYRFISAENFAKTTYTTAINEVYGKAENFSRKFATAKDELENLKQTSTTLKTLEDEGGGTCGNKALMGCGMYCWLRATEANEFGIYSDQISELNNKSQSIINNIQHELDKFNPNTFAEQQFKINRLVGDANELLSESNIVNAIKQGLELRKNRHSLSAYNNTKHETINAIDCSNEQPEKIRPGIDLALASLNQLQSFSAPALFDPKDEQIVQHRAWYVFKSMFITGDQQDITTLDRSPIFFGVSIDVLIFLLGLSGEITKHRKNILQAQPDKSNDFISASITKLKQKILDKYSFVTRDEIFITKLLVEQRGLDPVEFLQDLSIISWQYTERNRIFVVPVVKQHLTEQAKKVLAIFEELILSNLKLKITIKEINTNSESLAITPQHQQFVLSYLYTGISDFNSCRFTSYSMPTTLWNKLCRVWSLSLLPDKLSWATVNEQISKIAQEQQQTLAVVCELQKDTERAQDVCNKLYSYRQYWQEKQQDFNETWLEHNEIFYGLQPKWNHIVDKVAELESEASFIKQLNSDIEQLNQELLQIADLNNKLESEVTQVIIKQQEFANSQQHLAKDTSELFATKQQLQILLNQLSKEQTELLNRLDFYQQRQHQVDFSIVQIKEDFAEIQNKSNDQIVQTNSLFSWFKNHMPDFNKSTQDENNFNKQSVSVSNQQLTGPKAGKV